MESSFSCYLIPQRVKPPPPGVSNGAGLEYSSRRVLSSALDINHSRPSRY
ncbi:hypothetical protein F2Q68_00020824 [Brassica cretica]|uniref:Uncharacterized protein n=1 Tax=Brassica cretica TaxID=69181 RepID=A0A3N6QTS6_BRACR|nr:hypothetical protein F2Q68_00020824 [Brassica cretica]